MNSTAGSRVVSPVRSLLLVGLVGVGGVAKAAPTACVPKDLGYTEIVAAVEEGNAVVCFESHTAGIEDACLVVDPATGAVLRGHEMLAQLSGPSDDEPSVLESAAFTRCGAKCARLRKRLEARSVIVAAVDAKQRLLFEIEPGQFPTYGNTWSLETGKRISRFALDEFDGPPPPTNFDHAEIVGRHVFVGAADSQYILTYDLFSGVMSLLYGSTRVGHDLVVIADGMGSVDLHDYARKGAPLVAHRRVKSTRKDNTTMMAKTVVLGSKALAVTDDPFVTVLVDLASRTITKPRSLPRCQ